MPETLVEQVQTTQSAPDASKVVQEPVTADLITRVSQVKAEAPASTETTFKEFDDIKDPAAKDIAIARDKQRQADYTRKTQELAVQRKEYEQKMAEMQNWSPDRIQRELLNNPQFLAAAQQIQAQQNPPNSGLTDEQYSALTEGEKRELNLLKSEINQLKQSNSQNAIRAEISNRDAQLTQRFADYNPVEINRAYESLANLSPAEVREHIYKATLHDAHVKAAYEMGRQEGRGINQEKIGAISTTGTTTITNDGVPTRNAGEKSEAFFLRLAQFRQEQHRKK